MTKAKFVRLEDMKSRPTTGLYLSPRTWRCTTYIVEFHDGECVDSVESPSQLLCIDGHPIRVEP